MSDQIVVRLFGVLSSRAGESAVTMDVPSPPRLDAVRDALGATYGAVFVRELTVAKTWVNGEAVSPDVELRAGDEVALLPPFAGG